MSFYAHQPNAWVRQKPSEENIFKIVLPAILRRNSTQKPDWTDAGISPKVAAVPNPSKSTAPNPSSKATMPFEDALEKLETIVSAMESGDLPLESLIARYEEGVKLAKACQEKLAEAELKIQQLEKTAAGELKLKPLTAELSEE
jgi:exodeoxyribonuclease VII small subunit